MLFHSNTSETASTIVKGSEMDATKNFQASILCVMNEGSIIVCRRTALYTSFYGNHFEKRWKLFAHLGGFNCDGCYFPLRLNTASWRAQQGWPCILLLTSLALITADCVWTESWCCFMTPDLSGKDIQCQARPYFTLCLHISRSDIRPHTIWVVSMVIIDGHIKLPQRFVWVCMG